MRKTKVLTFSILATFFLFTEMFAQNIALPTLHTSYAASNPDSIAEVQRIDSLMREENRYHIPATHLRHVQLLERQIQTGDSILNVLASQIPAYRGPREASDIQRYYHRYNLMEHRVYPQPPRVISEIREDEYPAANPLFMPLVFNTFKNEQPLHEPQIIPEKKNKILLIDIPEELPSESYVDSLRKEILRQIETQHLDKFEYCISDIPEYERIDVIIEAKKPIRLETVPGLDFNTPLQQEVRHINPKYTYWNVKGRVSAQMTQTYISKNWSSGGESNMSGLYSFYWKANYDDKKNVQFDNFIDWKVGVNTNSSDTLRGYNISTDQFQISSKMGIKAIQNWYYSVQGEFITQTLTNYKSNTYTPKSSFLSPAKMFVSLGMDFKKTSRNKKHKISLLMTPLTYRMNFLMDTINFNPSKYGIEEGKKIGHEFGVKLTANYDWKINEDISWNSYFYYYSDFSYIDSEWKNTLNFKVNQYLSTQLFIHTKINDREFDRNEDKLIQLKEFLSFGVTYFW